MPKRKIRRLLNTPKNKSKLKTVKYAEPIQEVSTARGRLKGALLEALEPAEESDDSSLHTPVKRDRKVSQESNHKEESSSEDDWGRSSPPRQSYVLKLFDRSVDLSQFKDNSPLYPICRAWIANQPKANYKKFGSKSKSNERSEDCIELPGPKGLPVSRIPKLLPEQEVRSVENINFDYKGSPPPEPTALLNTHIQRWTKVRQMWLDQAAKREARYEDSQRILNNISI